MKNKRLVLFVAIAAILSACDGVSNKSTLIEVKKKLFTGSVEKGPYVMGSSVTIYELDEELSQTGKAFSTTIVDEKGLFEQRNLHLSSQYVELKADGYYFNEVAGVVSGSPLTLYALADINDVDNINVNILTTIERRRILQLVSRENMSFADARSKAHSEVLKIFGITDNQVGASEQMSLDSDALLLAVSAVIQGYRPTSEVGALLAALSDDLYSDGTIDTPSLISQLLTGVIYIDASALVENLRKRYLQVNYSIAEVEMWLDIIRKVPHEQIELIEYPLEVNGYKNALNPEVDRLFALETYAEPFNFVLASNTPKGVKLSVELRCNVPSFSYMSNQINWTISNCIFYDSGATIQKYEVADPGRESVVYMGVNQPCKLEILYYECGSLIPTRERIIEFVDED